jgi:hypothetical protein
MGGGRRAAVGWIACAALALACKSGGGMAPRANTAGASGGSSGGGGGGGRGGSGGGAAGSLRWFGRVDTSDAAGPRFAWSGSGFVARFSGTGLAARLDNAGTFVFKAVVDGVAQPALEAAGGEETMSLAAGLAAGTHTLALYRQTEGAFGDSRLVGVDLAGGALADPPPAPGRLIGVVGASVSCGYGDLGTSPCSFSFPTESHWDAYESVAARAVGAELEVVAISGRGMYRNSDGTTTDTMPMLYDRTLPDGAAGSWDFHSAPQAVVINLGKNDFATGDPGMPFVDAYTAFARRLRQLYPGALVVGATGPNLGDAAHAQQVAYVKMVIATRHTDGDDNLALLDWPEQTDAELGCDGHPNAAKNATMGAALAALLSARLGW